MILYIKLKIKEKMNGFLNFFKKYNEGMGTVEIILIIVVLIGLVIIFKEQITSLINTIFSKVTSQSSKI